MPYFIEAPIHFLMFPQTCPYCEFNLATETVTQRHTQLTGFFVVAYTYKDYRFHLPACEKCKSALNTLHYATVGTGVSTFAILLLGIFLNVPPEAPAGVFLFLGLAATGILYAIRRSRLRNLRVEQVKEGAGTIVFASASERYALEFAKLNRARAEKKWFRLTLS